MLVHKVRGTLQRVLRRPRLYRLFTKLRDELVTLSEQARDRREHMQRHSLRRVLMQWRRQGLKRRLMRGNLEYYRVRRMGRWQAEWFRAARRAVRNG